MDTMERTPEMVANKLIHTIQYGYPSLKYLGKFENGNTAIMTHVLANENDVNHILEKGEKGLQSVVNRLEKEWLAGREVVSCLDSPDKAPLPPVVADILNGLVVEKQPHITQVVIPAFDCGKGLTIYQEQGRNASSAVAVESLQGPLVITVRNRFNAYGDEKYLVALSWGEYALAIVVQESSTGVKGAAVAMMYVKTPDQLLIDRLDKYMDTAVLTDGVH